MKDDDKKQFVEVDGFIIPIETWEMIKDGYVSGPTQWEMEISDRAMKAVREVLVMIEYWVKEEDYVPSASSELMYETAHNFLNSQITLQVLDHNYVLQEKFLEILCGLENKELEANIMLLLSKLDNKLEELSNMLMH